MKIELNSFLQPSIQGQNSDTVVVNEISANQEPQVRSIKMLNRDRVILKQRVLLTVLLFFSMLLLFFANRFVLRSFSVNAPFDYFSLIFLFDRFCKLRSWLDDQLSTSKLQDLMESNQDLVSGESSYCSKLHFILA